jgi:hypothetical protein
MVLAPRDLNGDALVGGGPERIVAELPLDAGAELLGVRAAYGLGRDLVFERDDGLLIGARDPGRDRGR